MMQLPSLMRLMLISVLELGLENRLSFRKFKEGGEKIEVLHENIKEIFKLLKESKFP
jgi:hypothetical protein